MPQFQEFPYLKGRDLKGEVAALIEVCQTIPEAGELFSSLRKRLKAAGLWERERGPATLKFLQLACTKTIKPSSFVKNIPADGEAARKSFADRLWHVNPILMKGVIDCLEERVHNRDELYKFVDSVAFKGLPIARLQLDAWVDFAIGLGILKKVGISLGLDELGSEYKEQAADFDLAEFLEDDEPEQLPSGDDAEPEQADEDSPRATDAPVPVATIPTAAVAAVRPTTVSPIDAGELSTPHIIERPAPLHGAINFDESARQQNTDALTSWWKEQSVSTNATRIGDFDLDAGTWMENPDETLYKVAVCAGLLFRLGSADPGTAFKNLDTAGVLGDLYYGNAPGALPANIDAQALMLASVIARRCAETSELGSKIESQTSGHDLFKVLDESLGRGLFKLELFWIVSALRDLGATRAEGIEKFVCVPTRAVRDVLFRLGYIDSPYAPDTETLAQASAAATQAVGGAEEAETILTSFAIAAGCAYDCGNKDRCAYLCRERQG